MCFCVDALAMAWLLRPCPHRGRDRLWKWTVCQAPVATWIHMHPEKRLRDYVAVVGTVAGPDACACAFCKSGPASPLACKFHNIYSVSTMAALLVRCSEYYDASDGLRFVLAVTCILPCERPCFEVAKGRSLMKKGKTRSALPPHFPASATCRAERAIGERSCSCSANIHDVRLPVCAHCV